MAAFFRILYFCHDFYIWSTEEQNFEQNFVNQRKLPLLGLTRVSNSKTVDRTAQQDLLKFTRLNQNCNHNKQQRRSVDLKQNSECKRPQIIIIFGSMADVTRWTQTLSKTGRLCEDVARCSPLMDRT